MSQIARAIGNTSLNSLALAIMGCLAFSSSNAANLPTGGAVKFGNGTISQPSNQQMQINQSSDKLAIEWQSFNIAEGNKVNFQQPNSKSIALNRVVGTEGSKVMGQLNANGRVFLVNPNGVLFGNNAQVNVGGLVASTQDLTTTNFAVGKYNFSGGNSTASVVNQGTITASDGGAVVLLGGQVSNQGNIQANLGSVKLAAGKATTLDFGGDGLVNIQVTGAAADALAENSGLIQADGGQVVMSAAYANNGVLQTVVNNTGTIQAQTLSNKSGKIVLSGGPQGRVNVDGILDASVADQGNGGNVETSGQSVNVSASASVDTRGFGGQTGTWNVTADKLDVNDGTSNSKVSARAVTNNLRTSNVELIADSSDLTISNDISWNNANQLLLVAQDNIVLNANLKASGKNAGLALIEGGDYVLGKGKSVTLSGQGASFSNNGQSYSVIQNVNQLQAMENDTAGYYVLGNTIDASSTAQGAGFKPIGGGENAFSGIFSGLGNTINQLTIKQGRVLYYNSVNSRYSALRYSGLFGFSHGEIRNVGLVGANVSAGGIIPGIIEGTTAINHAPYNYDEEGDYTTPMDYVGSLAGIQVGGRIHDVYSENANVNNIVNAFRVTLTGGLIGNATDYTDISNVYATGTVKANGNTVGGLIGWFGGHLDNAYASVDVSSTGNFGNDSFVGGLIGQATGSVTNSYATGDVVSDGQYVGGLIGLVYSRVNFSDSVLSNLYASGNVSGYSSVGGLIGFLRGDDKNTAAIFGEEAYSVLLTNSYASGTVSGGSAIGGLVGSATYAIINNSYAVGNATGSGYSGYVGGLAGSASHSIINNSYAVGNATADLYVGGLVGSLWFESEVNDSYALGNVTGKSEVGGLVGEILGSSVTNSMAKGAVTGVSSAGTLIGYADDWTPSVISNSYGYGAVNGSQCTNSLYCVL